MNSIGDSLQSGLIPSIVTDAHNKPSNTKLFDQIYNQTTSKGVNAKSARSGNQQNTTHLARMIIFGTTYQPSFSPDNTLTLTNINTNDTIVITPPVGASQDDLLKHIKETFKSDTTKDEGLRELRDKGAHVVEIDADGNDTSLLSSAGAWTDAKEKWIKEGLISKDTQIIYKNLENRTNASKSAVYVMELPKESIYIPDSSVRVSKTINGVSLADGSIARVTVSFPVTSASSDPRRAKGGPDSPIVVTIHSEGGIDKTYIIADKLSIMATGEITEMALANSGIGVTEEAYKGFVEDLPVYYGSGASTNLSSHDVSWIISPDDVPVPVAPVSVDKPEMAQIMGIDESKFINITTDKLVKLSEGDILEKLSGSFGGIPTPNGFTGGVRISVGQNPDGTKKYLTINTKYNGPTKPTSLVVKFATDKGFIQVEADLDLSGNIVPSAGLTFKQIAGDSTGSATGNVNLYTSPSQRQTINISASTNYPVVMAGGKVMNETKGTLSFTHVFSEKQSSAIFKKSGAILGTALGGMSKLMLLLPPNVGLPSAAVLQTLSTATKTGSAVVAKKGGFEFTTTGSYDIKAYSGTSTAGQKISYIQILGSDDVYMIPHTPAGDGSTQRPPT